MSSLVTVVNDDNINEQSRAAGDYSNGIMLRKYKDIEDENRQAFYYNAETKKMPESLNTTLLGKRTPDHEIIKQTHCRDYTFSEVVGGTKGEQSDYMLIKVGEAYEYVPVSSRIKLNKKRLAQVEAYDSDGCQI